MNVNPKIVINGEFFCNNLTGIERFAYEITKRLDEISQKDEIGIIISKDARNVPSFRNLKVINYENSNLAAIYSAKNPVENKIYITRFWKYLFPVLSRHYVFA